MEATHKYRTIFSYLMHFFINLFLPEKTLNMNIPDIIIAIDGYSSTGKSSFAKLIAKEFGFTYLDSGALYRCVTLHALEKGLIGEDGQIDKEALLEELKTLDVHFESGPQGSAAYIGDRPVEGEIRSLRVSEHVSPVSTIPEVRAFVDARLHEFGRKGRIVMDGRDIGTSVFPNAEIKIFMTADPQVRAQRRFDEMKAKGQDPDFQAVLDNLLERDYIDSHREVSPLSQAEDAVVLDNTYMTFDDQMRWIRQLIEERFPA